jgi:hypothetical protein
MYTFLEQLLQYIKHLEDEDYYQEYYTDSDSEDSEYEYIEDSDSD